MLNDGSLMYVKLYEVQQFSSNNVQVQIFGKGSKSKSSKKDTDQENAAPEYVERNKSTL